MILSDFSSADEVRAVLGVAPEELEDVTLALPLYVRLLTFELSDMASDMVDQYLGVWSLPSAARTAVQQRFFDVVQLYSAYSVSKQLLTSLSLFAPKVVTDGRASVERQNDPYADVRAGVLEGFYQARRRLLSSYEVLTATVATSTVTAPTIIVATGLAVDPVTGA